MTVERRLAIVPLGSRDVVGGSGGVATVKKIIATLRTPIINVTIRIGN